MKRYGNLYEKIISKENLYLAYEKAKKAKGSRKKAKIFAEHLDERIDRIHEQLINGTFRTSKYTVFKVYEPKERIICSLPFEDRIVHHAIMNILEPIWTKIFIEDTYSCIKGRGIHGCMDRVRNVMSKDMEGTTYCLKIDIRKFYPTVNHRILKCIVRRKIKDKRLLCLLDEIIDSAKRLPMEAIRYKNCGVPIGNYLSQYLSNLYLSYFDHWMKEVKYAKYYFRYADDIVVFSNDKELLKGLLVEMRNYLWKELKLEIKPNYQIFKVEDRGLDFVGYRFYHTHVLLRKSIKKRFCRHLATLNKRKEILSFRELKKLMCSHIGWCKHANTKHLLSSMVGKYKDGRNGNVCEIPMSQILESIEYFGVVGRRIRLHSLSEEKICVFGCQLAIPEKRNQSVIYVVGARLASNNQPVFFHTQSKEFVIELSKCHKCFIVKNTGFVPCDAQLSLF